MTAPEQAPDAKSGTRASSSSTLQALAMVSLGTSLPMQDFSGSAVGRNFDPVFFVAGSKHTRKPGPDRGVERDDIDACARPAMAIPAGNAQAEKWHEFVVVRLTRAETRHADERAEEPWKMFTVARE